MCVTRQPEMPKVETKCEMPIVTPQAKQGKPKTALTSSPIFRAGYRSPPSQLYHHPSELSYSPEKHLYSRKMFSPVGEVHTPSSEIYGEVYTPVKRVQIPPVVGGVYGSQSSLAGPFSSLPMGHYIPRASLPYAPLPPAMRYPPIPASPYPPPPDYHRLYASLPVRRQRIRYAYDTTLPRAKPHYHHHPPPPYHHPPPPYRYLIDSLHGIYYPPPH